ncbi:MAG: Alpha-acetolactate decarboxylase, partial [Acidobacteriota bacterium]
MFQVSTLDALLQGVYQGAMTYGEVARHGDFGVGTFESVD